MAVQTPRLYAGTGTVSRAFLSASVEITDRNYLKLTDISSMARYCPVQTYKESRMESHYWLRVLYTPQKVILDLCHNPRHFS